MKFSIIELSIMKVSIVKTSVVKVSITLVSNNRRVAGFVESSLACDRVRVKQRFSPLSLLLQTVKFGAACTSRSDCYIPVTFVSVVRIHQDNASRARQ